MKRINTTIKTGDNITLNGYYGVVGNYKNGKIKITFKISNTSSFSEEFTVRKINQLIEENKLQKI